MATSDREKSRLIAIGAGASVAEVVELQRDAEVAGLEVGDDRLQVVALLADHPELVALGLALDALEAEALDVLVQLPGLVAGDAGLQRRALAHPTTGGILDRAVVERLE